MEENDGDIKQAAKTVAKEEAKKVVKRKIKEIGIHNWENNETAMLMKTIKIPVNMSQINRELPHNEIVKVKVKEISYPYVICE